MLNQAVTVFAVNLLLLLSISSCRTTKEANAESSPFFFGFNKKLCEDLSKTIAKPEDVDVEKIKTEMRRAGDDHFVMFNDFYHCADGNVARLRSQGKNIPANLNAAEIAMIMSYSGATYSDINSALRALRCKEFPMAAKALASGINKLPGYKGTLYRGTFIPFDELVSNYAVGKQVINPMFLSTSTNNEIARSFSENVMFEIKNGNGGYLKDISLFSEEDEVLLTPGTVLRVDAFEENYVLPNNKRITLIRMTQITESPHESFIGPQSTLH